MENNQIQEVQVRCVLKTGGPYSYRYVKNLFDAVRWHSKERFSFVCLTDDDEVHDKANFNTIELKHGWPGWWSKIELFRQDLDPVPCIYFDLDTIIKGNIDPMFKIAQENKFVALRGFNHRFVAPGKENFASGIMVGSFWKYSFVYEEFLKDPEMHMGTSRENWMHGDQGFIADQIGLNNVPRLQSFLPQDFIVGKRFINKHKHWIPQESSVIAWSGEPRLSDFRSLSVKAGDVYDLLDSYWRGGI